MLLSIPLCGSLKGGVTRILCVRERERETHTHAWAMKLNLFCWFAGDPLPSLVPLLDTCPGGDVVPLPLLGVAAFLDPLGETWLVAVTSLGGCAVVEVKRQRMPSSPIHLAGTKVTESIEEAREAGVFRTMSRELLLGPKNIPIPQVLGGFITTI